MDLARGRGRLTLEISFNLSNNLACTELATAIGRSSAGLADALGLSMG